MPMSFKERIEHLIESGFQAIYIPTAERSRCEDELSLVAQKANMQFVTWDPISGFTKYNKNRAEFTEECIDPIEALKSMDEESKRWGDKDVLFVMRTLLVFLIEPVVGK